MSFREFVFAVSAINDADADEHFRSQHLAITDNNGRLLTNYIGRLEQIDQDFDYVRTWLMKDIRLPNLMHTGKKPYTAFYDTELKNIVWQRYKADIEMFDYTFQ